MASRTPPGRRLGCRMPRPRLAHQRPVFTHRRRGRRPAPLPSARNCLRMRRDTANPFERSVPAQVNCPRATHGPKGHKAIGENEILRAVPVQVHGDAKSLHIGFPSCRVFKRDRTWVGSEGLRPCQENDAEYGLHRRCANVEVSRPATGSDPPIRVHLSHSPPRLRLGAGNGLPGSALFSLGRCRDRDICEPVDHLLVCHPCLHRVVRCFAPGVESYTIVLAEIVLGSASLSLRYTLHCSAGSVSPVSPRGSPAATIPKVQEPLR